MKARYFVALAVVFLVMTILGMRSNNMTAYDMRAEIVNSDRAGEDVSEELEELGRFTRTRMNATGGRMEVFLSGSYERADEEARAAAFEVGDNDLYGEAQEECEVEGRDTQAVAECAQQYIEQRLPDGSNNVPVPSEDEFTYVFMSPSWTPDRAGLSLIGAIFSGLAAAIVYARYWVIRIRNTGA